MVFIDIGVDHMYRKFDCRLIKASTQSLAINGNVLEPVSELIHFMR
jgi:hypothetical protein